MFELPKNPNEYSALDYETNDEFIDHEDFLEHKETGETYWRLDKSPEVQQFVALITKGILSTADIIQINGEYYSKEFPLEELADTDFYTFQAERVILDYVFRDHDKDENNFALSLNSSKNYFYDFDQVYECFLRPDEGVYSEENYRAKLFDENDLQGHSRTVLSEKLELLKEQVSDENLFAAVAEKATRGADDGLLFKRQLLPPNAADQDADGGLDVKLSIQEIQSTLLSRIESLQLLLQQGKSEYEPPARKFTFKK